MQDRAESTLQVSQKSDILVGQNTGFVVYLKFFSHICIENGLVQADLDYYQKVHESGTI